MTVRADARRKDGVSVGRSRRSLDDGRDGSTGNPREIAREQEHGRVEGVEHGEQAARRARPFPRVRQNLIDTSDDLGMRRSDADDSTAEHGAESGDRPIHEEAAAREGLPELVTSETTAEATDEHDGTDGTRLDHAEEGRRRFALRMAVPIQVRIMKRAGTEPNQPA